MTKREAYDRLDKGDVTWGHLKHWLGMVEGSGVEGMSVVNKTLTKRQSMNILAAGLDSNTQRRNALNSLIAVNVLREAGAATGDPRL